MNPSRLMALNMLIFYTSPAQTLPLKSNIQHHSCIFNCLLNISSPKSNNHAKIWTLTLPSKPAPPQGAATLLFLLFRSQPLESSLDPLLFFQHTSKFASLHSVFNPEARAVSWKGKPTELVPLTHLRIF